MYFSLSKVNIMKAFRTHRGVKIQRVKHMIAGSDFTITASQVMIPRKPEYDITFEYAGSYPYDTIEEAKDSIDSIWNKCEWQDNQQKEFANVMNSVS
jgi:hypothetical protein